MSRGWVAPRKGGYSARLGDKTTPPPGRGSSSSAAPATATGEGRVEADGLKVGGYYGGSVKVAHGVDCVAVIVRGDGVLSPNEARRLAALLNEQATYAAAAAVHAHLTGETETP